MLSPDELGPRTNVVMTCSPFAGESPREHELWVDTDGTVRVYDSVSGYYTTCHSMPEDQLNQARWMADDAGKPVYMTSEWLAAWRAENEKSRWPDSK